MYAALATRRQGAATRNKGGERNGPETRRGVCPLPPVSCAPPRLALVRYPLVSRDRLALDVGLSVFRDFWLSSYRGKRRIFCGNSHGDLRGRGGWTGPTPGAFLR